MKRLMLVAGLIFLLQVSVAQTNRERRLILNDYVAPEELVSMSKSLPFDKAMMLFSDFSKRYLNKIIVDATNNKQQIGVDIENKYWLQAFEDVLRGNKLWYDEREEFFYVYAPGDSMKAQGAVAAFAASVDSTSKVLFKQRDIRISSVFFTVDVIKSLDAGINWSFFYKGDTTQLGSTPTQFRADFYSGFQDPSKKASGSGSDGGSTAIPPGFFGSVIPAIKFSNVTALMQFFQNNQLGDVLSGPSIVVSSGKQGRIQVGQDIFITTRDFAGNTVQQPVSSGIIIDVKPTVYDESDIKFINLDIKAERSTVSAGPVINKSTAQTFSVLYDGEEMVLGGLYTTVESSIRGGVPFLKDLPWWVFGLRYLFGFEQTTSSTQELIILLKAEVVPTIEERVATAAQKRGANLIEQQREQNKGAMEKYKKKE
ncbi:MAG: type II and III secretion system protein [Ignavibacteriales bacterium]|nr:type II and III secretion system protein [Ignavibacteriales bacterium]